MRYLIFFMILGVALASECSCNIPDREQLGRSTWYLLHEIVKHADPEYDPAFSLLMRCLSVLYPCPHCRDHIQQYIDTHRIEMTEKWMCEFHNDVNLRLNKTIVTC